MKNYSITKLREHAELINAAAMWFHQKWGVPKAAYVESMENCAAKNASVPQWYVVLDEGAIVAGVGLIANDFHERKDLTPNVCAIYVEETHRKQGIAGQMLKFVCDDLAAMGIAALYLLTDHDSFYERYGWEFLCMAQGDGETTMSRMYQHRQ